MQLYAAGFNCLGQLDTHPSADTNTAPEAPKHQDIKTFRQVWQASEVSLLQATFTDTVLLSKDITEAVGGPRGVSEHLIFLGRSKKVTVPIHTSGTERLLVLKSLADGCWAAIFDEQDVSTSTKFLKHSLSFHLFRRGSLDDSIEDTVYKDTNIVNVAVNSTGRIAVVMKEEESSGNRMRVREFRNLIDFESWLRSDALEGDNSAGVRHLIIGSCEDLRATATSFLLLRKEDKEILTWGDGRYPAVLARAIDDPDASASYPSLASHVAGTRIRKVATCPSGWIAAAVTEAGEAFIWGIAGITATSNGTKLDEHPESLRGLLRAAQGGPVKVTLPGLDEDTCEIFDIAVGVEHCILLEKSSGVWVNGANASGQLGLRETKRTTCWTLVDELDPGRVRGVSAGDIASFVIVRDE